MNAGELAEKLMELRRYVTRDPEHARIGIDSIGWASDPFPVSRDLKYRLAGNLQAARDSILAEPEMARSYLFCAAAEIRIEAERNR